MDELHSAGGLRGRALTDDDAECYGEAEAGLGCVGCCSEDVRVMLEGLEARVVACFGRMAVARGVAAVEVQR